MHTCRNIFTKLTNSALLKFIVKSKFPLSFNLFLFFQIIFQSGEFFRCSKYHRRYSKIFHFFFFENLNFQRGSSYRKFRLKTPSCRWCRKVRIGSQVIVVFLSSLSKIDIAISLKCFHPSLYPAYSRYFTIIAASKFLSWTRHAHTHIYTQVKERGEGKKG